MGSSLGKIEWSVWWCGAVCAVCVVCVVCCVIYLCILREIRAFMAKCKATSSCHLDLADINLYSLIT